METCVAHNDVSLLRRDRDDDLFPRRTFGDDLNFSFSRRGLVKSGLVYLDNFPVGENEEGVLEFENVSSWRWNLHVWFIHGVDFTSLIQPIPDFINLLVKQVLWNRWGNFFHQFPFRSWVRNGWFSKLSLDFASDICFVCCVELVLPSFIDSQNKGEGCFPKHI